MSLRRASVAQPQICIVAPQCDMSSPLTGLWSAVPAGTLVPKAMDKARYVHFEDVLASGVGERWTPLGWQTKVCERSHFRDMRDVAYALNSIPHVPAAKHKRTVISFIYKQPGDKRRMIVDEAVLQKIQARYPGVEVRMRDVMLQDADAQLQWLSQTSILVANVGSPSIRLLYLPDGAQVRCALFDIAADLVFFADLHATLGAACMQLASMFQSDASVQVISVGSLEGEMTGTDGKQHKAAGRTFGETRDCWAYLDYITIHKYHVTDPADITLGDLPPRKPASAGHKDSNMWRDQEATRIRNAHVHVRAKQLLGIIEQALANLTG